jgi:hypothetical protein
MRGRPQETRMRTSRMERLEVITWEVQELMREALELWLEGERERGSQSIVGI